MFLSIYLFCYAIPRHIALKDSYTMSGAHTGGFWGFRDLRIREREAVSSYIMAQSTVILEDGPVTFGRRVSEVAVYEL